MIRRPPRSKRSRSSAASDVYKRRPTDIREKIEQQKEKEKGKEKGEKKGRRSGNRHHISYFIGETVDF